MKEDILCGADGKAVLTARYAHFLRRLILRMQNDCRSVCTVNYDELMAAGCHPVDDSLVQVDIARELRLTLGQDEDEGPRLCFSPVDVRHPETFHLIVYNTIG